MLPTRFLSISELWEMINVLDSADPCHSKIFKLVDIVLELWERMDGIGYTSFKSVDPDLKPCLLCSEMETSGMIITVNIIGLPQIDVDDDDFADEDIHYRTEMCTDCSKLILDCLNNVIPTVDQSSTLLTDLGIV